jgi:transcriptional regulator with XRE-family HTH domain
VFRTNSRDTRSEGLLARDVEKRSGLLCVYISRIENGHTTPSVETLEKIAPALEVQLYQLFYEGEERPHVLAETGRPSRYCVKLRHFSLADERMGPDVTPRARAGDGGQRKIRW